jgi:hypothetical protein
MFVRVFGLLLGWWEFGEAFDPALFSRGEHACPRPLRLADGPAPRPELHARISSISPNLLDEPEPFSTRHGTARVVIDDELTRLDLVFADIGGEGLRRRGAGRHVRVVDARGHAVDAVTRAR